MVVEVPIKNLAEENVSVSYGPDTLTFRAELPSDEVYSLELNLHNAILPDQCFHKVRQSKIEIILAKAVHSHWEKLEKELESKSKAVVQTKNWDKVVKDNWSEKDEERSVNQLFSKLYANGNDDQKRAMMKSFTESNGTVLSMDWGEVGKKKVEVEPSDDV